MPQTRLNDNELKRIAQHIQATREGLHGRLDEGFTESNFPFGLREGMTDYILDGVPTGSFLEAVIDNDLREAIGRADYQNRRLLFEIVSFMHNYAPRDCWGHEGARAAWTAAHMQVRKEAGKA